MLPAEITAMAALLQPAHNGVSFLLHNRTYDDLIDSLLRQYNFQRGWQSAAPSPRPALVSLCSSAPRKDVFVHFVEIPARDVFLLGPGNIPALASIIFHKMCVAFEVPEYYGYHFDSLYHFLSDLSWLEKTTPVTTTTQGHVLVVSITQADNSYGRGGSDTTAVGWLRAAGDDDNTHHHGLALLDFYWRLLEHVAQVWSRRGVTFHTFVLDRTPYAAATRVRL